MKEKIDAKNDLESYTYQLKSSADDDKNALEECDRVELKEKVDEVMKWLETAQNAEKEEIDSMKKELEDVAKPIMSKLYGQGGESGGMPDMSQMPGGMPDMSQMPGGMPDMSQMPGGMPDMSKMPDMKPTVEEVD